MADTTEDIIKTERGEVWNFKYGNKYPLSYNRYLTYGRYLGHDGENHVFYKARGTAVVLKYTSKIRRVGWRKEKIKEPAYPVVIAKFAGELPTTDRVSKSILEDLIKMEEKDKQKSFI